MGEPNSELPPVGATSSEWRLVFTDDAFRVIAHWMDQAIVVFPEDCLVYEYRAEEFKRIHPADTAEACAGLTCDRMADEGPEA